MKDLKVWGSLPEKDRIKAIRAIEKKYPPEIADAIRGYLLKERLIPSGE